MHSHCIKVATDTLKEFKKSKDTVEAYIEDEGKMTRMQSHIIGVKGDARNLDNCVRDMDQILEFGVE